MPTCGALVAGVGARPSVGTVDACIGSRGRAGLGAAMAGAVCTRGARLASAPRGAELAPRGVSILATPSAFTGGTAANGALAIGGAANGSAATDGPGAVSVMGLARAVHATAARAP